MIVQNLLLFSEFLFSTKIKKSKIIIRVGDNFADKMLINEQVLEL